MPDFDARDLSDVERWVSFYEWFVDSVRDGYDMCIYEYTNDLSCRDQLELQRGAPQVTAVWPQARSRARVESAQVAQKVTGSLRQTD